MKSASDPSGGSVFLGKYEVARRIAGGGMAEIYLGLHRGPSGLAEAVAIKCVRPELAEDRQFVKMLHQEAGLAVLLDHPNIVHVYEIGEHDGQVFLAMEYLLGETLGALARACEKGGVRVPCGVAARILAEAARGLHYAHNLADTTGALLHIVHRDVSPQNIFVTSEGVTKLLDFGIAKAATALEQTQAGVVKGKYAYLSPEQARGEPVDPRSDVFSLGVCAWEFLTGERLFAADHSLASLHAVTSKPIPPLQRIRPDVPARLDSIVRRALIRKKEDRWQTAGEMADALDEAAFAAGGANVADVGAFVRKLVGSTIDRRRGVLNQLKRGSAPLPAPEPISTEEPWMTHAATSVADLDELRGEPSRADIPSKPRPTTSYAQAGSALAPSARYETTPHIHTDRLSPGEGTSAYGGTPSGGVRPAATFTPQSGSPAAPRSTLPLIGTHPPPTPFPGVPAARSPSPSAMGNPIPTIEISADLAGDLPMPEITMSGSARAGAPAGGLHAPPSGFGGMPLGGFEAPRITDAEADRPSRAHTIPERPGLLGTTGEDAIPPGYPADDPPTRAGRPKLARNLDELKAQLAGKLESSERRADVPAIPTSSAPEAAMPIPDLPPPPPPSIAPSSRRSTQRLTAPMDRAEPKSGAVAALRTAIFVTIGIVIGAVVVFLTPKLFAPPNVGRAVILVTPLDADLEVDGRRVGRGSARLDPLAAGTHRVRVTTPDGRGVAQSFEVSAGKTTELRIEILGAAPAQPPQPGGAVPAPAPAPAPR
ncbi:MAG: protein kinase [Deltaproteobacteria bacterium]|nr:protein kinase [Deltaproteobacteria bacterium]